MSLCVMFITHALNAAVAMSVCLVLIVYIHYRGPITYVCVSYMCVCSFWWQKNVFVVCVCVVLFSYECTHITYIQYVGKRLSKCDLSSSAQVLATVTTTHTHTHTHTHTQCTHGVTHSLSRTQHTHTIKKIVWTIANNTSNFGVHRCCCCVPIRVPHIESFILRITLRKVCVLCFVVCICVCCDVGSCVFVCVYLSRLCSVCVCVPIIIIIIINYN